MKHRSFREIIQRDNSRSALMRALVCVLLIISVFFVSSCAVKGLAVESSLLQAAAAARQPEEAAAATLPASSDGSADALQDVSSGQSVTEGRPLIAGGTIAAEYLSESAGTGQSDEGAAGASQAGETAGTDYSECSWFPSDKPKKDGRRMLIVYKGSQSVVAYLAKDGEWTVERIMICSTGKVTPTGDYDLKQERYEYHELFDANGQYCTRIIPHYLVHSLPYDINATRMSRSHDRMEIAEYELLGTAASKGCIRLLSIDAKWVYDNCKEGTPIHLVTEAGPEPPEAPKLIYEEPYMTADGYGWDPTDPDVDNPYARVYGRFE